MADSVVASAPAKINVGLSVFPRRADGYHDIEGVFTTVSLHDTLSVSIADGEGECLVECPSMLLPAQNTFNAAYKAFCVLTGIGSSVRVTVDKRIPSGGGLGGGSSDAASFIQSID
ncbi:MAG: 4-(cytidine 5'-diphospho)-2-C-methyl-D-erythritol kinase, partial [Treponema sp.]|nr:4-(cytidine 5'-diphospho)-2-C-methyl-D-erythritol kinase [Treponema sp.]